ncbi:hypothetical protein J6A31_05815 [bacterium]|nr:hypothetical protein [bacterium]
MNGTHHGFGLCRGKRVDNDEWVIGYIWRGADRSYIIPSNLGVDVSPDNDRLCLKATVFEVKTETVSQFTFLSDKNDKNIYYNDYVWDDKAKCRYRVGYYEKFTCVGLFDDDNKLVKICDHTTLWEMQKSGTIFDEYYYVHRKKVVTLYKNGKLTDRWTTYDKIKDMSSKEIISYLLAYQS